MIHTHSYPVTFRGKAVELCKSKASHLEWLTSKLSRQWSLGDTSPYGHRRNFIGGRSHRDHLVSQGSSWLSTG
jgi:hypothetical protein